MSWEAVILKVNGPARPVEDVAEEDYLPLGSTQSIAAKIRTAFPTAQWSSPTCASWVFDVDTGVTLELAHVESSNSIHVSVSGSGDPIPQLLALADANGWTILDCGTSEFLSDGDLSSEGWEGYQSLLRDLPNSDG